MLSILLQKIEKIIPVLSIYERSSGIEIEYLFNNIPSEAQIEQINLIIDNWPIDKAKLEKIKSLDNNWKLKIKSGWQTPDGYSLGIDVSDVALLNGVFTLAKEANSIGITDLVNIVDVDGQSHAMNLQDLTILMLQYGQARASLSNAYAIAKQNINDANSLEELEAINITL